MLKLACGKYSDGDRVVSNLHWLRNDGGISDEPFDSLFSSGAGAGFPCYLKQSFTQWNSDGSKQGDKHQNSPAQLSAAGKLRTAGPGSEAFRSGTPPREFAISARTDGEFIPTGRNTTNALLTIATIFVRKSNPAPPIIVKSTPLPRPNPMVQRGGISATAIATPGRAVTPPLVAPRDTTMEPARPENKATPRSRRFGFVLERISGVNLWNGSNYTRTAEKPTAAAMLRTRLSKALIVR